METSKISLPAYLFLYDENGVQIVGDCIAAGREGAIEIMNSSYGIRQAVDSCTGNMTGARIHAPVTLHKQVDKVSPYLAIAACEGRRLKKAVIKYYEINEAGTETEIYTLTLDSVVISSLDFTHVYYPGSATPNMHEVIGLRFHSIEWRYVRGNIRYYDAWLKQHKDAQRTD